MVEDLQKIFVLSEVEYSVLLAGKGKVVKKFTVKR